MSTARLLSRHQSIRKYNPGMFQSDHDVIQQFVVRKREFRMVLDILRGNIDSPSCQHILLVAPRGMGKSMMLARLVAEIRNNRSFADHLLPVRFMDESHEISSMTDFWLELLSYLANEIVLNDTDLAGRVQKTHAYLAANWNSNLIEDQARSAVFEIVDNLQKRLVVMVENMQDICEHSGEDFGWKLREILQMEPQIILLATANRRFKALDDANEAYFELFRIFYLGRLETQECRCLWQMTSGTSVSQRDIRPLEILTSGNPRLLVTVAASAQHRSIRQLMESLAIIIDNQTEYFCHQLEALPKTERRIYLAVIDLWKPSTVSEIARRARVDIRVASIMLGRLIERGSVTASGSKGKRLYVSTERLLSMYYHFRKEGNESTTLQNIIRFMSAFYKRDEAKEVPYGMIRDLRCQSTSQLCPKEMLAELHETSVSLDEEEAFRQAHLLSHRILKRKLSDSEFPMDKNTLSKILFKLGWRAGKSGEIDTELTAYGAIIKQFESSESDELQLIVAQAMLNWAVAQGRLKGSGIELGVYDEILDRFSHSNVPEMQWIVARTMLNQGIIKVRSGETEAGLAIYGRMKMQFDDNDSLEIQVLIAESLIQQGVLRHDLGDTEAALMSYEEVIDRFSDRKESVIQAEVAGALFLKGVTRGMLGDIEGELTVYNEVIKRFGCHKEPIIQAVVAKALINRAHAQSRLGDFKGALEAYEEVMQRFGDSRAVELQGLLASSLLYTGFGLHQLGKTDAALSTFYKVVDQFGDSGTPEVRVFAATALTCIALENIHTGSLENALNLCESLTQEFGSLIDDRSGVTFRWHADCMRMNVLLIQRKSSEAIQLFRSIYLALVPTNESMIRDMNELVLNMISKGISERNIIDILSSDESRSDCLIPLISALVDRTGEVTRNPPEVTEVVLDILREINEGPRI